MGSERREVSELVASGEWKKRRRKKVLGGSWVRKERVDAEDGKDPRRTRRRSGERRLEDHGGRLEIGSSLQVAEGYVGVNEYRCRLLAAAAAGSS